METEGPFWRGIKERPSRGFKYGTEGTCRVMGAANPSHPVDESIDGSDGQTSELNTTYSM